MGTTTLIIPAAGKPNNPLTSFLGNLPNDTLLPIHGKTVLNWNISYALTQKIDEIIIITNKESYDAIDDYIQHFYPNLNIKLIKEEQPKSLGKSVSVGLAHSTTNKNVIVLGDSIYLGEYDRSGNWLTYRDDWNIRGRWCRVDFDSNGMVKDFYDKVDIAPENTNIVAGVYGIADKQLFVSALEQTDFDFYGSLLKIPLKACSDKNIFDCGHIDTYYLAKTDLLRTRQFNNLSYNKTFGTITKSSENQAKIMHELTWYKNIPDKLKVFCPRLTDYSLSEPMSYTIEYYGYNNLQDYYISNTFDESVWLSIVKHVLDIKEEFKQYRIPATKKDAEHMYIEKLQQRLLAVQEQPELTSIMREKTIIINGQKYDGFEVLMEKFVHKLKEYCSQVEDFHVIHGDLCFSNILFDIHNKIIKLVDPRGIFGSHNIFGDLNYDLAKLRHSICGEYDFIVTDLFSLSQNGNEFNFTTLCKNKKLQVEFDQLLREHTDDVDLIKLIEANLFISMLPLHSQKNCKTESYAAYWY